MGEGFLLTPSDVSPSQQQQLLTTHSRAFMAPAVMVLQQQRCYKHRSVCSAGEQAVSQTDHDRVR